MSKPITPPQFHDADGVEDWRVVFEGAVAHYCIPSFAAGVGFVEAVGRNAEVAGHAPDVDLRPDGVTVRLFTPEAGGISALDLQLAQQISTAARNLEVSADLTAVQTVQVDVLVAADVMPFWRAVLGYEQLGDEDLVDPRRHSTSLWFQDMEAPRTERNRLHIDVSVPHDQAEARVAAALAAGGRLVSDAHAPQWWTLADAEGNEVDVATWMGRD